MLEGKDFRVAGLGGRLRVIAQHQRTLLLQVTLLEHLLDRMQLRVHLLTGYRRIRVLVYELLSLNCQIAGSYRVLWLQRVHLLKVHKLLLYHLVLVV